MTSRCWRRRARLHVPVCLLAIALIGVPPAAAGAQEQDAQGLEWLAGCWEMRTASLRIQEHWLAPVNGELLGVSRTIRDDEVVAWEYLRIHGAGDGRVLEANPAGQPRAAFALADHAAGRIEFANPAHDFPQRIRYRALGADSLIAEIAGVRDGAERVIRFPYGRVACMFEHVGGR